MAKSIRRIRKTNHQTKLDSVENFRKRRFKTNNSLKETPLKAISDTRKNRKDQFNNDFVRSSTQNDDSSNRIDLIKQKFSAYEESSENEFSLLKFPTNMNKQKSQAYQSSKCLSNDFDINKPDKRLLQRRDRAQSENDTESIFHCEKASLSPRKFRQKHDVRWDSSDEEEKKEPVVDNESYHSDQSDEDETDETSKSPPIKRTMSEPKIKILEKSQNLPKINEVDEDADISVCKKSSDPATVNTISSPSSSLQLDVEKKSVPKFTRQKSEDLKENELKDSPYDEEFFYYLDLYLEEAINKIADKNNRLLFTRNRSLSEA